MSKSSDAPAPAAKPHAIPDAINTAVNNALKDPDLIAKLDVENVRYREASAIDIGLADGRFAN